MSYLLDHRLIAEEMELFVFNPQIGAGLLMWLPNGVAIRDELEKFIRELERRSGYQRVVCPHIGKASLYEKSGHLRFFKENMFAPLKGENLAEDYYLKPMNCPHHHMIYAANPKSWRNLPLRLAEYGQVYRHENSGSLHGLSRARSLCQNDAHIYLMEEQLEQELGNILDLQEHCYQSLGLKGYRYRLSKYDPSKPENFEGSLQLWEQSEALLRKVLLAKNLTFYEAENEAAFYGPKIDVQMRIGQKEESIASLQLDFLSAKRFDIVYRASSGKDEHPWIIHRAPLGSHERFVAMLLEYYDGRLPGWLCPVQVMVIPLGEEQREEAALLVKELLQRGIRAKLEESAGSTSTSWSSTQILICPAIRTCVERKNSFMQWMKRLRYLLAASPLS